MNRNTIRGLAIFTGTLVLTATVVTCLISKKSLQKTHTPTKYTTRVSEEEIQAAADALGIKLYGDDYGTQLDDYATQPDDYVDVTEEDLTEAIDDALEELSEEELAELAGVEIDNRIFIGDGEGEVSRTSSEYRQIINEAYGESLKDPETTLMLFGKVNGLGARGEAVEDEDGTKGRVYNAADIEKLRKRMSEN